ncbi:MAG: phosphatidylserine decarboxylase family protein [Calditrichaeota bacterium]|nr:phosphatidylserine decarboxylase family protein [Calditrichota bacterium]
MTRDGYGIVFGSAIATLILAVLYYQIATEIYLYLAILAGLFTLFCINFFRDPDATDRSAENQILSPAQGKVVQIREIEHDEFIGGPAQQISIFLNVFNIHVNSHPIGGVIKKFEYRKGKMLAAFNHMASEQNEQTVIYIENEKIRLIHKQITGLIARRIICRVKEGETVAKGQRFGMIRFGSRCDVIVPKSVRLTVDLNQKVERGETVIGELIG